MIKVYQIQLTAAEVDAINNNEMFPKAKAFFGTFKAENLEFYTHVANVDTSDMEEAFKAMNLWDEGANVEKVTEWCSSMSVGDVLELEDGTRYRCASWASSAPDTTSHRLLGYIKGLAIS